MTARRSEKLRRTRGNSRNCLMGCPILECLGRQTECANLSGGQQRVVIDGKHTGFARTGEGTSVRRGIKKGAPGQIFGGKELFLRKIKKTLAFEPKI